MKILLSEHAGFCFGVRRAVELLEQEIRRGEKEIFTLGHIIHNEDFNDSLARRGVKNIDTDALDHLPENALVFVRTHGVPLSVMEKFLSFFCYINNCPSFVSIILKILISLPVLLSIYT